jgi:hypothetical protein
MANDDYYNSSFNIERYKKVQLGGGAQAQYADGSDAYANIHKMVISFYHVPSGRSVYFKAFIDAFNETYSSNWNGEDVYGRADKIYMFKNTTRDITLAFKIPAATESEAYENLGRASSLAKFCYAGYENPHNATTIQQSPLVRIKVMNLLQSTQGNTAPRLPGVLETSDEMYRTYTSNTTAQRGVLGVVKNLVINHNIPEEGVLEKARGTILPKLIDVNLSFSVLHENRMGWDAQARFGPPAGATSGQGSNTFPYGVTTNDNTYAARQAGLDGEMLESYFIGQDMRTQPGYQQALQDEAKARYQGFFGGRFGDQSRIDADATGGDQRRMEMAAYAQKELNSKK